MKDYETTVTTSKTYRVTVQANDIAEATANAAAIDLTGMVYETSVSVNAYERLPE
jgi:hypothetical protein